MNILHFSQKVQQYRRATGHTQQDLAALLGFQRQVLGRKFSGKNTWFNLNEIKQIIIILAEWQAITTQEQVVELLSFIDLKRDIFSDEQWLRKPFNQLDRTTSEPVTSTTATPTLTPPPNPTDKPANHTQGRYNNLPAQLTSLVGRDEDVERVGQILLQPIPRLLTLVGPGGSGKTRLAVEIGQRYGNRFRQGVCYVSLAGVSDPSFIVAVISQALGLLNVEPLDPLQNLQSFLADQQLLLILDNFEQLLVGAGLLETLLKTVPALKVIVTSRSVLHLYGEQEFDVSTLAFPGQGQVVNGTNYLQFDAIRLFFERARAFKPDIKLTDETAGLVAQICELLGGLPLSIELAASRVKLMPLENLLARLTSHRLDFLSSDATNLPQRHRTLRDTFDWSYELLAPEAQRLFRVLGLFKESFSVEAVQAICQNIFGGRPAEAIKVLKLLGTLLDNSLIQVDQSDHQPSYGFDMVSTELVTSTRFKLLNTVREYTLEQLDRHGETAYYQHAELEYYGALCAQLEKQLNGPDQLNWYSLLDTEYATIRSTIEASLALSTEGTVGERSQANLAGLTIYKNLSIFMDIRGKFVEGRAIAGQFVEVAFRNGLAGTPEFAWGVCWKGIFNGRLSQYAAARRLLEESYQLFATLDEKRGATFTYIFQGTFANMQGNATEARQFFSQAKEICRKTGDKVHLGEILINLGIIERRQGNYIQAASLLQDSLQIFREQSNSRLIALALFNLGINAELQQDYSVSRNYYTECIRLFSEQLDNRSLTYTVRCLGKIAYFMGDYTTAFQQLTESLRMSYRFGDKVEVALNLALLAIINVTNTEVEAVGNVNKINFNYLHMAAQLSGCSDARYKEAQTDLLPVYKPIYKEKIGKARAWLGEDDYNFNYLKGFTASLTWIEVTTPSAKADDFYQLFTDSR